MGEFNNSYQAWLVMSEMRSAQWVCELNANRTAKQRCSWCAVNCMTRHNSFCPFDISRELPVNFAFLGPISSFPENELWRFWNTREENPVQQQHRDCSRWNGVTFMPIVDNPPPPSRVLVDLEQQATANLKTTNLTKRNCLFTQRSAAARSASCQL